MDVKILLIFKIVVLSVILAEEVITVQHSNPELENVETHEENNLENLPSYIEPLSNVTNAENVTIQTTAEETNVTQKHVSCLPNFGSPEVQIANDTELINLLLPNTNITNKDTPANCIAVLFFSSYCPFSSMAAPHFNALPRAFPDIKMVALNAMMFHLFNTQNGIVGVPTILLFHNGRAVAKYNESDYTLEHFSRYITKYTGINAEDKSFVTSADFAGPVSSVLSTETDMFLVMSWSFIIFCAVYYFMKSKWWVWIVETVQSNWRESEAQAQHEHAD